jgi:hypothetical protein
MKNFKLFLMLCLTALFLSSMVFADTITSTGAGGNWSATGTWVGDVVPGSSDDVIIADGATVTIDASPTVLSLQVGQGVSGILIFDATVRAVVVTGNVTVMAGGTFITQAATAATHTLAIGGDLTNNGTFDMSRGGTTLVCNVTFNKNGNQTISGSGATTRFNLILVNMGTSFNNILDIAPTNFAAPATAFVTLTNGTLKMSGSYTLASVFFTPAAYSIPATGGFWLNNANITVTGQNGSPTNSGYLRVTAGTFNVGTNSGNSIMAAGTTSYWIFEGGITTVAGRMGGASSFTVNITITGGIINVANVGNASSGSPSFGSTNTSAGSFIMSGGTINLVQRNTTTTASNRRDYNVTIPLANCNITGGTVNVGTSATAINFDFCVQGAAPNIVIDNSGTAKSVYTTTGGIDIFGDLTLNTGTQLNAGNYTIYVWGNPTNIGNIVNAGTIITSLASGKIGFRGSNGAQTYSGGGVCGTAGTPIQEVRFVNSSGVVLNSPIITASANILTGTVTNSSTNLTIGAGGSSSSTITVGSSLTGVTSPSTGSFDAAPIFNIGSGGLTVTYRNALNIPSTGYEIPSSRTINNLTINNSGGGATLAGGNLTVNGAFTLTAGTLTLGSNNLVIGSSATVSGGSATSYVATNGAGVLTRQAVGATDVAFPVGTATTYNPVTINNAGTADDFSVNVKSSFDNPPVDVNKVVNRQWAVSEAVLGGSNATVVLQWGSADEGSSFNRAGSVTLGRYNGSLWEEYSASVSGTDPYTATASGITNFSPFAVGNGGALPIQLASFVGSYVGNYAKLEWSTISEVNNYGFNVQRLNGNEFVTIGFVAGKGTTLEPQSYSYLDVNAGTSYRLEQIDNNGLKNYFGPVMLNPNSVDNNVPAVFKLNQNYPNPFNPATKISFSLANAGYTTLKVYNIVGSEIATLFTGNAEAGRLYTINFDAKNLTSGLYFTKLLSGNSVEIRKMTLIK